MLVSIRTLLLIPVCLWASIFAPVAGAESLKADWSPAFEHIGIDEGLSQSVVTSIHQDRLGFIWFGTQEGLNRFDGRRFRVYRHDPEDPDSLSSSSIEAISGDAQGRLWLGTDDGGLNVLDPRTGDIRVLRSGRGDGGLRHDRVLDIAFDGRGVAWLGTEEGLDRVELESGEPEVRPGGVMGDALAGRAVTQVLVDPDGTVWAGTRASGLFVGRGDTVAHFAVDELPARRIKGNQVTGLARGKEGSVWLTTRDGGLDRVDGDELEVISLPGLALPDRQLTAILVRDDGSMLVGSEDGYLYRISTSKQLTGVYHHDGRDGDSLAGGAVRAIFEDRTGVLWVGSYAGGISKSKSLSGKVTHGLVGTNDGRRLPDALVRAIWVDGKTGSAWIGTNAGLAHLPRGADDYEVYEHRNDDPRSLGHDTVYAVLGRANGQIWVATRNGLDRFDPASGGFVHHREGQGSGLPDNRVRDLAEDPHGRLWVATEGGLARYEDATGKFSVYRSTPGRDGLSGDEITSVFADREGYIWIGTNTSGLNRLDPDTGAIRHFGPGPEGLSHHSVWDVIRIEDTVWVGTFSGGLNRIDLSSGEITHYLEADGLANNVVYQIVPDDRGRLWLSTNSGISVLEPATGKFLNYNPHDGLLNYEYNSNASFRDDEGIVYFGGINGLDIIDASRVNAPTTEAVAALTDLRLFNQPVDPATDQRVSMNATIEYADSLSIGYRARVVSFGLGALHFANPDTNRLRYRLDGLHDDWLVADAARHQVTFNSLPAGEYSFRVQASARGTKWGSQRVLRLSVAPPPWLSPAAYAAYAGVAILMLAAAVRAHFRRIGAQRRHVEELNRMVAERTVELEALNEQLKDTNERLELATRRDPLTGLANRRELLEWLPREQAAAARSYRDWARKRGRGEEPEHARLGFLAVDIDDFKRINDTWGHMAGDRILSEFARRLQDHCRTSDLAVRWGGEEFLLVMRSVGPRSARQLAERIRRAVETQPVSLDAGRKVSMTCSIGFACYPFSPEHPEVGHWEDVLGLADAALYAAKRAGKNAWIGIGCPREASERLAAALLRDPAVRAVRSDRAVYWKSRETE